MQVARLLPLRQDIPKLIVKLFQSTGQSNDFTCLCMARSLRLTDHKPLVSMFSNPSSKPSARIQRWLLELQQYRFTLEYRRGASNPADYASRHRVGDPESHSYDVESEEHISLVARSATPKAVTLSEIESATAKDSMLQAVMSAVKSGCWHNAPRNYWCSSCCLQVSYDHRSYERNLTIAYLISNPQFNI